MAMGARSEEQAKGGVSHRPRIEPRSDNDVGVSWVEANTDLFHFRVVIGVINTPVVAASTRQKPGDYY